jgi:hypothetical protein
VIVAVWYKSLGHDSRYFDSAEVVTGSDGWATIAARSVPKGDDARPNIHLFKPGYHTVWKHHGSEQWLPHEFWRWDEAWEEMARTGIVLELSPAKTREERRKTLPLIPGQVPETRMKKYLKAFNQERRYLGFTPLQLPFGEDEE